MWQSIFKEFETTDRTDFNEPKHLLLSTGFKVPLSANIYFLLSMVSDREQVLLRSYK
jgi:hypothetical protein